jgi:hypothetical protein
MIRVKALCSWTDPHTLFERLRRQSQDGDGRWNDLWMSPDHRHPDWWLVVNAPRRHGRCLVQRHRPERTILWSVEHQQAGWRRKYRYSRWERDPRYRVVLNHRGRLNWVEFHVGHGYAGLKTHTPEKTRTLSAVIGPAYELAGHRLRVDFLRDLEGRDLSFLETPLDHYGHDNRLGLAHYRGALPPYRKEAGLDPYRYSLAVEAVDEPNYATEKIFDCILCETLPFYWGCSNLEDWLEPESFVRLDLEDPDRAYRVLRDAVEGDAWSQRLPALRRARRRILEEYNVFPVLERIVRERTA